jgi:hypothetical protein
VKLGKCRTLGRVLVPEVNHLCHPLLPALLCCLGSVVNKVKLGWVRGGM